MAEIREITPTGERRRAREYALQILYQLDLSPVEIQECLEGFWEGRQVKAAIREFTARLVRGVAGNRDRLDGLLTGISHHWRLARMAVVDRNVLRLALYEMVLQGETPPVVVINEAIEVAKKFGDDDSGPFINGILDAVRIRMERGELVIPDGEPPVRTSA